MRYPDRSEQASGLSWAWPACRGRKLSRGLAAAGLLLILGATAVSAQTAIFSGEPAWFSGPANASWGAAIGDVNGDGHLDLVFANGAPGGESSTLFLNQGGFLRESPVWFSAPVSESFEVALGDIDNDGDLDVVLANGSNDASRLYLNDGGSLQANPAWSSIPTNSTSSIALGDVNNDGFLDLVCANTTGHNTLYLNLGGILAPDTAWAASPVANATSVALGDVNGDGWLDAVFGNGFDDVPSAGQPNTIYLNRGGTFSRQPDWQSARSDSTTSVALGDIDGDGRLDLVFGNGAGFTPGAGRKNYVYINRGGTFPAGPDWDSNPALSTYDIALGDVDGDGWLDLVCANLGAPNSLHLNAGGTLNPDPDWEANDPSASASVVLGDITGDGFLDVVFGNNGQSSTMYLNQGAALSRDARWTTLQSSVVAQSVALGDVTGDGNLDLVLGTSVASGLRTALYAGQGGGLSPDTTWASSVAHNTTSLAVGDVDGDGWADVVCGNAGFSSPEPNTLYRNTHGSLTRLPVWTSNVPGFTLSVALGDIDNDGYPELVCGNGRSDEGLRNTIYANHGGVLSADTVWSAAEEDVTHSIALGDIDNDGYLDMVCGNGGLAGGHATLYLNRGGVFARHADWTSADTKNTQSIALGDVDADGDLDLVCGNYNESSALYLNENGTFGASPAWSSFETRSTRGVVLADVDADGDLDLLCGNSGQPSVQYRNDGGLFARARPWESNEARYTSAIAVGDVDNDGDLDLACADLQRGSVLFAGNANPPYRWNPESPTNQLPNNSAMIKDVRVDSVATNRLRVQFTAFDVESDDVWIVPDYQYRGEPVWRGLDVVGGATGPFASSPAGRTHAFDLDIQRLALDRRVVVGRFKVRSNPRRSGRIQHASAYLTELGTILPLRPEITISTDTLAFATVTVGDTVTAHFQVINTGSQDLSITHLVLPSVEMSTDQPPPFELVPGARREIAVRLHPVFELAVAGGIEMVSNDPFRAVSVIDVQADIRRLAVQTRLLSPADSIPLGEAVTVIVAPFPGVRLEEGHVFHRAAGTADFDSIPLVPSSGDWIAVIPGAAVRETGLEYYVRFGNAPVWETDPPGAPDSFLVRAVSRPAGVTAHPRPNNGDEYLAGEDVSVDMTLPVGAVFVDGTLHYREAGNRQFQDAPVVHGSPPRVLIPGAAVTARGVEYWVEVTTSTTVLRDPRESPQLEPHSIVITVPDLVEPRTHPGNTYRLLSLPLQMPGSIFGTIVDELGGSDITAWRLFAYEPATSKYVEYSRDPTSAFQSGRAYWLISREDHRIGTGPDRGRTHATTRPFEVVLQSGYNLVGNPFTFDVPWDSVRVDTLSMADPLAATLVQPPIAWDGAQGYRYDAAVLEPFDGYWVKNLSAGELVIRIPAVEAGAATAPLSAAAGANGWQVQIVASSREARGRAWAGVAPGSRTAWDVNDRSSAPTPPDEFLAVYFAHRDWDEHPDLYARDLRGEFESAPTDSGVADAAWGQRWDFDVAKGFVIEPDGDAVALAFSGIDEVPAAADVALVDRRRDRVIDLRTGSPYTYFERVRTFVPSPGETRFALLVGSREFVATQGDAARAPRLTALHQNYPNPFNPTTVIRYDVATPGRVTVRVYAVSGRPVRTLEDTHREAGRYEVQWNGEDDDGRRVASGVYFYRLAAPGFTQSRKLVVLR